MPSFPSSNDPLDPFALLTCDGCGRDAFRLRPALWDFITLQLCDTCYGDGEADRPTEPTLPAVNTVQWHDGLPANELHGCTPEPSPGTYCAAAYMTFLEHSEYSVVPAGLPVLCDAHMRACFDDAMRMYPRLHQTPEAAQAIVRLHAGALRLAAEAIARRISARINNF